MNSRKYQSIFGIVDVRRAYYWKSGFDGVCPLDIHFNLPERLYSHLLVRWTQDGITEEPYDKAIERIQRIFGINLSKRGQEDLTQQVTQSVEQFYRMKSSIDPSTEGCILLATADCKGVTVIPTERTEQTTKSAEEGGAIARAGRGRKGLKRDERLYCQEDAMAA